MAKNKSISNISSPTDADDLIKSQVSEFENNLRIQSDKAMADAKAHEEEIEDKMSKPLNHDEKIIADVEGGYMFVKGVDGIVYHRTLVQHRAELESRYFVEPPRAPQQQVIAKLF